MYIIKTQEVKTPKETPYTWDRNNKGEYIKLPIKK